MDKRTESSLMLMIDKMVEDPDAYLLVTAKHQEDGSLEYSFVISDVLHGDRLLNIASEMLYAPKPEIEDDL